MDVLQVRSVGMKNRKQLGMKQSSDNHFLLDVIPLAEWA